MLRIGGFRLPNINLAKLTKSAISGAMQSLTKAAGNFFKSGFDAAKQSLLGDLSKLLNLPKPPATLGSPSVPSGNAAGGSAGTTGGTAAGGTGGLTSQFGANNTNATQSTSAPAWIEQELGKGAAAGWENMPKSAQEDLQRQAALQRASRITSMMTNLLQALHEMNKSVIQNFRA
jgi:hypothetical protein